MVRKSRNQTDRPFLSNQELTKVKWGTVKDRLTGDSQLPFGYCALSLKPAKDPMCTSQGWVYDKEMILNHLVTQKQELKEKMEAWELQEKRKKVGESIKDKQAEDAKLQDFADQEMGLKKRQKVAAVDTHSNIYQKIKVKIR